MPNRLPVPKELEHLLEKRDQKDRRSSSRRKDEASETEEPIASEQLPAERRTSNDRRKSARRKDG